MEYFQQSENEFKKNQDICIQFNNSSKDNVDQSEVHRIQRALTQSEKSLQSMEKEANLFKDKEQQNILQKIKKYRNSYLESRNAFYKFENDYNLKKNKQALINQQQKQFVNFQYYHLNDGFMMIWIILYKIYILIIQVVCSQIARFCQIFFYYEYKFYQKTILIHQQELFNILKDPSMSQRDKLLNQGELLKSQNSRLQETTILAHETQNIVIQIQQELLKDKESINRMNSKSKDTQKDLKSADQILNDMTRRLVTNKIILVLIIIVLFLLIIIILFLKLKKFIPLGIM